MTVDEIKKPVKVEMALFEKKFKCFFGRLS